MSAFPAGKPGLRAVQRATTTTEGITAVDTWTIYTPEGEYVVPAADIRRALETWELERHVNSGVLAVVNNGMQPPLVIADNDGGEDTFTSPHHARPADSEDASPRSREEGE